MMDEAVSWIEKAKVVHLKVRKKNVLHSFYSTVLQERAKDFQLLNLQMARFGNKIN